MAIVKHQIEFFQAETWLIHSKAFTAVLREKGSEVGELDKSMGLVVDEPTQIESVSPFAIAQKKDRTLCFHVNYRGLDEVAALTIFLSQKRLNEPSQQKTQYSSPLSMLAQAIDR